MGKRGIMKPGDLIIYGKNTHTMHVTVTVPQPVLVLEVLEIEEKQISFRGLDSKGGLLHWECFGWEVVDETR